MGNLHQENNCLYCLDLLLYILDSCKCQAVFFYFSGLSMLLNHDNGNQLSHLSPCFCLCVASFLFLLQGGFIRQELFYLLKDEKGVHFAFGSVQKDGIHKATKGMHSSKFCLNIAGDTPSSNRLFDAIASHCVPVIISDDIELPYEDVLDYSEFCIFVRTRDALKEKFLINLVKSIGKEEWTRMWKKLQEVASFYEFQYPSKENDAVQMIWEAVARKVAAIRMKIHKSRRFSRSLNHKKREFQFVPTPKNFW